MRQIRRERPTLRTAHDFHQKGHFLKSSPEHVVSDQERQHLADEIAGELASLIKTQFPRGANLEYAILKAHLIVEYAVGEYIRCVSDILVDSAHLRKFSFANKIEVAYLLGLGATDALLLPTIERLNKIRNQVAHSFVLDRALVDEMLRVNSNDYDGFNVKDDKQRVRMLRWLCNGVAAHISAQMTVKVHWLGRANSAMLKELATAAAEFELP
ncbi:hypothetical protein [Caulobacter soli]|uniref:hypothetical protein n=1 Tax=Caulobacter soli TaxID=2708539 RepID=UPI0013EC7CC5|nr:hypothetical protein [Caulobacter soli]